tara:strand:- start:6116 stop:6481 length:366 start_codon:yes stop_codon:yes gene_type:complete
MTLQNRWVLLKHVNAPGDVNKLHFDLLLEDGKFCRTWRLDQIPILNGQAVEAIDAPLHKLDWLEKTHSAVSGGRGWATRVHAGFFYGKIPLPLNSPIKVELISQTISGYLQISNGFCRIYS